MLTFGSLFAGIGGMDLGLERAGMTCAWQVEIDDYASKVLAKHWPNVARFRDVRDCGAHNLMPVDLVAGGFPCQPHALTGKRLASADERDLWGEFARIISELKPRWVLAENVPGLLSSEDGRFFGRVLRDLAASGYDAEWDCIPAAAVGAPHIRDRVFLLAYSQGVGKRESAAQADALPNSRQARHELSSGGELLANTPRNGHKEGARQDRQPDSSSKSPGGMDALRGGDVLAYANGKSLVWTAKPRPQCDTWHAEPAICRVLDGVPARLVEDRLRGLGNAVVPQVAEWIGLRIIEAATLSE